MSTLVASSSAIPPPPLHAAVAVASGVTERSPSPSPSPSRHSPSSGSLGGTAPTAFGSAKSHLSHGSASSSAPSGCRLLWRGRLALAPKQYLDGIAIVAHLFAVPSISPSVSISRSSPFAEDPFAASSTSSTSSTSGMSTTSAADLCLGLEMMRGSDIKLVTSDLKAIPKALAPSPVLFRTGSGHPDKGKAKEQVETVIVDTPTDLRIYIDPRCPETTTWFQDIFCRAGCEGSAVRLDAGGEEVIVFAPNLPTLGSSQNGPDSAPRPAITLSLGRAVKIGPRLPRPDDPMPRENLFTKKLRRTTSMPMLDFQAPAALKSINPLSRTSSLASIKERPVFDHRSRKLSTTTSLSSLLSAEATSASRRTLQRSTSSKDPFGSTAAPPSKHQPFRRSTSSSATTQPFRSKLSSNPAVPLKRSRSMMSSSKALSPKVMVESPPSSPTSEVSAVVRRRSSSLVPAFRSDSHIHDREGSPSPSCVSNAFEDEDEEMDDRLPELGARRRSTNSRSTSIGEGAIGKVRRSGMTLSESAPVGVFKLGLAPRNPTGTRRERDRSTSLAPSAAEGIEARNKATIRKLLLSSLTSRGVTREDERFTEVFSITLRGVQFALRDTFKTSLLNKPHGSDLICRHLDMYISAPRESSIVVKHEEEEAQFISDHLLPAPSRPEAGMPTPPRSLEPMEVESTL
ncbi:BZ3500_MvSof-1268-A1-R1_Chr1-3g02454 [Microbotryum saponariae]|uniref:BZ3500_MvSof-1268-A1-R1_Chr1-3g02454 protein n=1 Tax=Microbotryum saponariae TaxID=289078 RepID=A0A2X0KXD8_9BASI|nr:BZ3500_MvSof-1268-A1-R1_Chr1-3g02454 [Microbotryum saponariae]SCZ96276.1 BZ3501_MvSof-1269-A2-R1_Chr1-3g02057 [Microbotryum saponariae]